MGLTFGSIFAGVGGFDAGFEAAGMECRWQIEIDKRCQKVLGRHWPNVARYDDVRECGRKNLEPVDIICFGFPCTDVSIAGSREGIFGERTGLFFEACRILQELCPRGFAAENVPGLLSSYSPSIGSPSDMADRRRWEMEEDSDIGIAIETLTQLGYCVSWRVLDAQFWSVAQRRERLFLVGSFRNTRAAEVFPLAESLPGDFETRPKARSEDRTGPTGDAAGSGGSAIEVPDVAWCLQERDWRFSDSSTKEGHLIVQASPELARSLTAGHNVRQAEDRDTLIVSAMDCRHFTVSDDVSGTLQHKSSGGHSLNYGPTIFAFSHTGKLEDVGEVTPPARASASGRSNPAGGGNLSVASSRGVRRLTPIEYERLQGFPDNWTALAPNGKRISDSARYKMLGNAVNRNVSEWLGRRIVKAMEKKLDR